MATDNPKVSGYVPPAVYAHLMQFKTTKGCASISQALTTILEEYFGLGQSQAASLELTTNAKERLEDLEGKLPA